jgi:hypothetical protein
VKLEAERSVYRLSVSPKTPKIMALESRFPIPKFHQTGQSRPDPSNNKEHLKMKKFMSALVLAAVASSLVACAKVEDKKPEMKTEAPKVVEETAKTTSTTTTSTAPDAMTATTTSTVTTTSAPATK